MTGFHSIKIVAYMAIMYHKNIGRIRDIIIHPVQSHF